MQNAKWRDGCCGVHIKFGEGFRRHLSKAFPLGGRWHGEAVTDEGAMIERFFVGPDALIGPLDGSFRRGISPPAGGEFLCPWRQRNQNATGDGSDERFALIFAFPRPPFTGVIPWARQNPSGAQNQECLSAVPSGPTGGLSGKKIVAGAFPLLRLPSPNQRPGAVFRRRGAQCAPAGRSGTGPYGKAGEIPRIS